MNILKLIKLILKIFYLMYFIDISGAESCNTDHLKVVCIGGGVVIIYKLIYLKFNKK